MRGTNRNKRIAFKWLNVALRTEIMEYQQGLIKRKEQGENIEVLDQDTIEIVFRYLMDDCNYDMANSIEIDGMDAFECVVKLLSVVKDELVPEDDEDYKIIEKIKSGIVFFRIYRDDFLKFGGRQYKYSLDKNNVIEILEGKTNKPICIIDRDGNVAIEENSWKTVPEEIRTIIADKFIGVLRQELLQHQLELREYDGKVISLEEFMKKYMELKKAFEEANDGIQKEEAQEKLNAYISKYAPQNMDDVILLTEDNIDELLGMLKEEIESNPLHLHGDGASCCGMMSFIASKLEDLKLGLEKQDDSSEKIKRLNMYLEYLNLSYTRGTTMYCLENDETNQEIAYITCGLKRFFEMTIDGWIIEDRTVRLVDESVCQNGALREIDSKRAVDDNEREPVTAEEFLKAKLAKKIIYYARQELLLEQWALRENDDGYYSEIGSFNDIIPRFNKVVSIYTNRNKSKVRTDEEIEGKIRRVQSYVNKFCVGNHGGLILTEDNLRQLFELLYEGMTKCDLEARCDNKCLIPYLKIILTKLRTYEEEKGDSPERLEKIETINMYIEWLDLNCFNPRYGNWEIPYYVMGVSEDGDVKITYRDGLEDKCCLKVSDAVFEEDRKDIISQEQGRDGELDKWDRKNSLKKIYQSVSTQQRQQVLEDINEIMEYFREQGEDIEI